MQHEDRLRAESFGSVAALYDRARPSYPAALVDDIVARRVLDVGCGTGIASRLFLARGSSVLGVEPDEAMAAVARASGVDVEVSRFETWDPRRRTFDLVISAQAWHWVDTLIGVPKAASVLVPGGVLALFWNHSEHAPHSHDALQDAYRREAPWLVHETVPMGGRPRRNRHADAIAASAAFAPPATRVYVREEVHTKDEWLAQLATHSDHITLEAAVRSRLLGAVGAAIDALGGSITVRYETELILARRR